MVVRIELRRDAGKIDAAGGPWIRRERVARVLGPPDPRALAELVDHRGSTLGFGLYSPDSSIVLRMLAFGDQRPATTWLGERVERALRARTALGFRADGTTGYREINSEGDGLPGLVVDRFGDQRVAQITTAPMHAHRTEIVELLRGGASSVIVVAPESAAAREGFTSGSECFGPVADSLAWLERGLHFEAPSPASGAVQKTGGYHDQRDNRAMLAELLRRSPVAGPLLDLGTHVGGFALAAARAGRPVIAVDQNRDLLARVQSNADKNSLTVTTLAADMFGELREPELDGPFAAIVFDPPKIANNRRELPRALAAVKRTLGKLLGRVAEDGFVVACSCSHHLDGEQLDRAMTDASGRTWTRIASWGPGLDHPVWPGHREGDYLRVRVYQRRGL